MKNIGSMKLIKEEVKEVVLVLLCFLIFGFFIGVLFGVGVIIVVFLVYGMECNFVFKVKKEEFG